jgi:beta-phosphoglucomutase-like phosphatase (HAD superfamily)
LNIYVSISPPSPSRKTISKNLNIILMTLLIFDIDGTLTNTKDVDDYCFISAFFDEYKIELKNIDWSTFKNVTDYGLFIDIYNASFNRNPTKAEILKFQKRFFENLNSQLKSNPEKFKSVNGASNFIKYCLNHTNFKNSLCNGWLALFRKFKITSGKHF